MATNWTVFPEGTEPSKSVAALAEQVGRDGGRVLAIYQEPLKDAWQIFALLPLAQVEPTPYQRDLSKPHVKRLQEVIKRLGRFVDPIVVVSTGPGKYWTPNGNHRREALTKLKAEWMPAILIPEPEVAYQILALNTEKAHNVKEKSLEVIRMYRGLVEEGSKATEEDFAFQFEAPHFITLGLLYDARPRFAGGAFAPLLRRVDKFLKSPLAEGLHRARAAGGAGPRRGRCADRRRRQDQEARGESPVREELRPRPHDAAQPGAEDLAVLRADVRAAPREPRGVRPGQGPDGRDRPLGHVRGARVALPASLPGRRAPGVGPGFARVIRLRPVAAPGPSRPTAVPPKACPDRAPRGNRADGARRSRRRRQELGPTDSP